MMKKEVLIERIEKATATIAKKENTITKKTAQIEKKWNSLEKKYNWNRTDRESHYITLMNRGYSSNEADEISWTISDIESLEEDIERGSNEIAEIKERLAKYEAELQTVIEKENSRNVKAILDFLADWKEKCINYHIEMLPKYIEARNAWIDLDRDYSEKLEAVWGDYEKYREIKKERDALKKEFGTAWGWIGAYVTRGKLDMDRLEKDYQRDCELKYDDIIERTNDLIGEIKDASGLEVNNKAGLDGIIVGERGTVKVNTISAGGYNIQCFHFRTLIHKIG